MKIKNTKKITALLFLVCMMHSGSTKANVPLSDDSVRDIEISALKGGAISLGAYILGYWITHDWRMPRPTNHLFAYFASMATGAGIMALWKYHHVPEAYFNDAKNGVIFLAKDSLLTLVSHADEKTITPKLKEFFFKEKFPLVVGFKRLEMLYETAQRYSEWLQKVAESNRTELQQESMELILQTDIYQAILKDAITIIKNDSNFIAECNAQTMVEMQHAQMVAAQAAQSNAHAAWANFFKPSTQIVVL